MQPDGLALPAEGTQGLLITQEGLLLQSSGVLLAPGPAGDATEGPAAGRAAYSGDGPDFTAYREAAP